MLSAIFAVTILAALPVWAAPPQSKSGPDLSLTMSDSPDPVMVGDDLTYAITVKNHGPSAANAVTVTDTLPAKVTFVSSQSSQGSCSGTATVTCNLGKLGKNATATVNIVVKPTEAGSVDNTASVKGDQSDPKLANNSAAVTTTVNASDPNPQPAADLAITMSDSPDPAAVGGELTYSIQVTNSGPSQATGVVVTDVLPSAVELISASSTSGNCSGTTTVTCSLQALETGSQALVTIKVRPLQSGTISNGATVQANQVDPVASNNSASSTTTIQSASGATADLTASFNFPPSTAIAGSTISYSLFVQNVGAATAERVKLVYPLPQSAVFVSADVDSPHEGHCLGTSTVTCNVMDLPADGFSHIRFRVKGEQVGTLTTSITASTSTPESSTSNNTAIATTQIQLLTPAEASDIAVTVSDVRTSTSSRSPFVYTVDVANLGPNDSGPWTVGASVPQGTSLVSVTSSRGTCSSFGGLIDRSDPFGFLPTPPVDVESSAFNCALGTMKNGDVAKVVLTLQPNRAGFVNLHVEAFLNCFFSCLTARDPETRNNYDRVTTKVDPLGTGTDLWIGKFDHIVPWVEPYGHRHTFQTTIINGGTSGASSMRLVEELPAGSIVLGIVPSQGTCTGTTSITCNLGELAVDGVALVTIVVRPPAGPEGVNALVSRGQVSSNEPDSDPVNNRAVTGRSYITRPICLPLPC